MPISAEGLYYEDQGSGDDVLLWIHGFGSSTRGFNGVAEKFDDHRSILVDLPGFGRSAAAGNGCRFPDLAAAAHGLMQELGIDRYSVIGMSMGGGVGLRMALDHPEVVQTVIGVVPFPAQGMNGDASDAVASMMAALHGNAEALRAAYTGMSKLALTGALDDLVEDSCNANRDTWVDMMAGGGAKFSQFDELESLSVPFCSIIGADDIVLSVTDQLATAARVPHGRAVVLSGLGHLMAAEDPQRVFDEVRASMALIRERALND
ncbi:alpha/beta fold hydrolase [Mycobacterium sp. DL440]|uniref:alpha/beta fold hydrolase n=1 Tax=Mycobacterium sp. DL440 TaxID=2675523 RepID=UPI00141F4BF9|nr:alpha/beta hydrolase [Mycobacterium sp. DL440]